MVNANKVVNSLGPTFVSQLAAERGAEPADVVRAFRIAREVTGADARWDAVEGLPRGIDRGVVTELMVGVDRLVEATTRWYLDHDAGAALEEQIAGGRGAVRAADRRAARDRLGRVARAAPRRSPTTSSRRACPRTSPGRTRSRPS